MQGDNNLSGSRQYNYLDFELEIGPGCGHEYPVTVIRSPAGEAPEKMHFPFDELALESRLKDLQIALLRSGGLRRKILSQEEQAVQDFGQALFDALLTGEVRSRYDVSRERAAGQGKGLRLKLRIQSPQLAALPWEFIYDQRQAEYVCLSRHTPLVRYLELPQVIQALTVTPPLRILGMIASPSDLVPLDVKRERQRVERALKDLLAHSLVYLEWLSGQTWRDLQRVMRGGPWHIFHFIGHGGFDSNADEGLIALEDDDGLAHHLHATELGRLLANHYPLRFVLLNSCEGARGSKRDIFSSTAAILVRRGIPAVLAMQYEITDQAAIEFARVFYEALADGLPVDAAVAEARVAVSLAVTNTVEWGTPVLYMRSSDGILFDMLPRPSIPQERLVTPSPKPPHDRLISTIGIETLGGISTPLLYKGTELPAEASQTFSTATDNQPSVEVNLVYGENKLVADNLSLGRFILDGILPAPRGVPQIDVVVHVDTNWHLSITATDRATTRSKNLGSIDLSNIEPPPLKETPPAEPGGQQGDGTRGQPFDWNKFISGAPGDQKYRTVTPEEAKELFGGDFSDFFCTFFGDMGKTKRQTKREEDLSCDIDVTLEEAALGTKKIIEHQSRKIEVKIPPGVDTGTTLRLQGMGKPGQGGSPAGDLYLVIQVAKHPLFIRQGSDLYVSLPITSEFAVSGGQIRVPELAKGKFCLLTVPPETHNGASFRLQGKGIKVLESETHGDLIVTIETFNPRNISPDTQKRLQMIKRLLDGREIEVENWKAWLRSRLGNTT